jgi:soluble lytic murein transglycosylase
VNSSEKTRAEFDMEQRFPMPLRGELMQRSADVGLDPAYAYGLIRQESRFIMDARSHAGASGLMQIMPATAKWTAKKIGLSDFKPAQLSERDVNLRLGTAYLKLVLDDFSGSQALAAAAYNAGPGRPRRWREGPVLDATIWVENVPFIETRDYVKKVLSNATYYAALMSGKPASLRARLGSTIGPRDASVPEASPDLP